MRQDYRFSSGDAHLANIRAMAECFARFATGAGPDTGRFAPARGETPSSSVRVGSRVGPTSDG